MKIIKHKNIRKVFGNYCYLNFNVKKNKKLK